MGFGGLAYLEGTKVRYNLAIGIRGTVGSEGRIQLAYGFGGVKQVYGSRSHGIADIRVHGSFISLRQGAMK